MVVDELREGSGDEIEGGGDVMMLDGEEVAQV